ncbi:hypothetical protein SPBR_07423 [Sporothrix brasiliensis 5110]|uniref:Uncharacterized protein n=1 Tax=Sporothrix brasiliensis 5110 TaxID=1398154 RepID=A0A0C2ESZ5_9PEZI|nr:uncharacterized protein SPBR_07423 [Sporothrix brasiliensis 5110]KIH89524.1 hypothetical protein SPBR_07423 [Sporothrix brasiliensis 5110]
MLKGHSNNRDASAYAVTESLTKRVRQLEELLRATQPTGIPRPTTAETTDNCIGGLGSTQTVETAPYYLCPWSYHHGLSSSVLDDINLNGQQVANTAAMESRTPAPILPYSVTVTVTVSVPPVTVCTSSVAVVVVSVNVVSVLPGAIEMRPASWVAVSVVVTVSPVVVSVADTCIVSVTVGVTVVVTVVAIGVVVAAGDGEHVVEQTVAPAQRQAHLYAAALGHSAA